MPATISVQRSGVSSTLVQGAADQRPALDAEEARGGVVEVDDLEPVALAAQQQHAHQRLGEVAAEEPLAAR